MEKRIYLKKSIASRISNGHPWIYENEVEKTEHDPQPGDIIDIFTYSRQFIGRGYYNPFSKIRARILTRKNLKIDKEFFRRKILSAFQYRKKWTKELGVCRIFFSEADGISGLVIDKYEDKFVIQINAFGIENFRKEILEILIEEFNPLAIFEKSDLNAREKERLPLENGILYGKTRENFFFEYKGLKFFVNLLEGQKTGFYLDQKDNSITASEICTPLGKEIVDVFSNTGNFGLRMLEKGASEALFIDQSEEALKECEKNLVENNFKNYKIEHGNAFDILRELENSGKQYDIINLDPPSFTKSRSSRGNALRGYKEVNLRALRLLRNEGFLITSSCSQSVSRQDFEMMVYSACTDVGCGLRLVYRGGQPLDHPVVLNIFETEYLKFYIFQKETL